jgi:tetratricopeptide (TPR) repeat protein
VNLGNALVEKDLLDDAVAEYRAAIATKQVFPEAYKAYLSLGIALIQKGERDEAIKAFREAVRLNPECAEAHYRLGNAFFPKRLDDAIVEFREAIRLEKNHAEFHYGLALTLDTKGQLNEAIAAYREAIRLKKNYAHYHYALGNTLAAKGQLDEAIAAYREAIRLKDDHAEAHCNLGHTLRKQGKFHKALEELRRGHKLGSKNRDWHYRSDEWVRRCERLVDLDHRFPSFLDGTTKPANPAEGIELAGLCSLKRFHRAAARFYDEAFAEEPELISSNRYNAACAAAQAGCGQGKDADKLDENERRRLRCQALDWLRADLEAKGLFLEKDENKAGRTVAGIMRHWLDDPDFAGVRGAEALAELPEVERQAWQTLWKGVSNTLARAQGKTTPDKKSGAK